MAISDYAHLAFNTDGNSTFDSAQFGRLEIEPYKTWLYLHSKELWRPNESFSGDTIAQFSQGALQLFNVSFQMKWVEIHTPEGFRHDINLFFCDYCRRLETKEFVNDYFGGICCSGYLHPIETWFIDIAKLGEHSYYQMNDAGAAPEYYLLDGSGEDKKLDVPEKYRKDAEWIGITPEMVEAFLAWDELPEDWVKKIREKGDFRFANQGNRYFARHGVNIAPTEETVGAPPEVPAAMRLLKKTDQADEEKEETTESLQHEVHNQTEASETV
jgi:hypothetical protein